MLAILTPPRCGRHRLGRRDHVRLGEDALALLVRGTGELAHGLGDALLHHVALDGEGDGVGALVLVCEVKMVKLR